mgnify:CR=1 FL=1
MILIYNGLPGSGKTTAALEWVAENPENRRRMSYDELRLSMFGPEWKFNRPDEYRMQAVAKQQVFEWAGCGYDVVIDNTNLTEKARQVWKDLAKICGVPLEEEDFAPPVALCVERDAQRKGKARVGRAVIERMALFNGFIDWDDPDIYEQDRRFIIVDMDGTLADCSARRLRLGPHIIHNAGCTFGGHTIEGQPCPQCAAAWKKNWDAFFEGVINDPPIRPIVNLVEHLSSTFDIIVVSGRSIDQCGKGTEAWLQQHLDADVTHLFMRNGGDSRPDYIVKQEILDLLPKERIAYVIDDRPQVMRMWQANGLTTLAVGDLKEF